MDVFGHPSRQHRRVSEHLLERTPCMVRVLGDETVPNKVVQYLIVGRQSFAVVHTNLLPDGVKPNVIMKGQALQLPTLPSCTSQRGLMGYLLKLLTKIKTS